MNHSGDTNKMVGETPRTDAALMYSICLDLQDENNALKDRIKRLEEAGDALKASGYFGGFGDAVNKWNKAKEAKP
jgi:hypothetical protein